MHAIRHPTFPSVHVLSHVPSPDSALRRGRLACPHGSIHSGERCCRRATSCWLPLVACGRHSLSPPILTSCHQMNPQPLASVSPARCALLSRAPRHLAGSPPSLSLAGLHRQLSSPHSSHCCLNQHLLATFPSPWAHVPVRPNNPRLGLFRQPGDVRMAGIGMLRGLWRAPWGWYCCLSRHSRGSSHGPTERHRGRASTACITAGLFFRSPRYVHEPRDSSL